MFHTIAAISKYLVILQEMAVLTHSNVQYSKATKRYVQLVKLTHCQYEIHASVHLNEGNFFGHFALEKRKYDIRPFFGRNENNNWTLRSISKSISWTIYHGTNNFAIFGYGKKLGKCLRYIMSLRNIHLFQVNFSGKKMLTY